MCLIVTWDKHSDRECYKVSFSKLIKVVPRVPRPLDEGPFCIFLKGRNDKISDMFWCLTSDALHFSHITNRWIRVVIFIEAFTESRGWWNPVRYIKMNGLMSGVLNDSRGTRISTVNGIEQGKKKSPFQFEVAPRSKSSSTNVHITFVEDDFFYMENT